MEIASTPPPHPRQILDDYKWSREQDRGGDDGSFPRFSRFWFCELGSGGDNFQPRVPERGHAISRELYSFNHRINNSILLCSILHTSSSSIKPVEVRAMFGSRCVVFFFFLCWLSGLFFAFAAPSDLGLLPRNVSSQLTTLDDETTQSSTAFPVNSDANVTTITNTTALIRDSNGVDITSSFRIKVYNPPPARHITNLSEGNQLNGRQTGLRMTQVVKVISSCPGENLTFVESHCAPHEDEEMPFQAFVFTCRKVVDQFRMTTGEYLGRGPIEQSFPGRCQPDELCVDGFGDAKIASCVHTALFDDYMIDKDGTVKGMLQGEIFDVGKAWAVIMKKDPENAPLKARKLGIDAWNNAALPRDRKTQRKTCVNCAEVETELLQPEINSLRLEATLMTAGAVGGILWLAMGAG